MAVTSDQLFLPTQLAKFFMMIKIKGRVLEAQTFSIRNIIYQLYKINRLLDSKVKSNQYSHHKSKSKIRELNGTQCSNLFTFER